MTEARRGNDGARLDGSEQENGARVPRQSGQNKRCCHSERSEETQVRITSLNITIKNK